MVRFIERAILMSRDNKTNLEANLEIAIKANSKGKIKMSIEMDNAIYQVDIAKPWSLAIPIHFNQADKQPNHFAAKAALSSPMKIGNFIGDTKQGGSCNVNELSLNPHCNGTHTESIAHICDFSRNKDTDGSGSTIAQLDLPPLMPCVVISMKPELAKKCADTYTPNYGENDQVISLSALKNKLKKYNDEQLTTVVIRTLPNKTNKCRQLYNNENQPAFFSREAILYLNERNVEHLVVDVPSIDRLHDNGLMTCHHLFWQVTEGTHQVSENSLPNKTITEMAFIPDEIVDDFYFITIQTPAFHNDAAPSRPVLFSAKEFSALKMSK
jgi:kynurenine formamidase